MGNLVLKKASLDDAELIHSMQLASFKPLLEKYNDVSTNPANERIEKTKKRLRQNNSYYYLLLLGTIPVGAIRITRKKNQHYRLSPIFILPAYQGNNFAKLAIQNVERLHKDATLWELDTISEEEKLCKLYEKLGYLSTGKLTVVNDQMSLVRYEKSILTKRMNEVE